MARYRFAARHVAGGSVLDLACGTGYGSVVLAAQGAAAVIGIDVCPEALDYARHRYGDTSVEFIAADAGLLPLAGQSIDVVVSFETIEHIFDYRGYLQEVSRVLRPDGIYIVSTPNATFTSPNRVSFTSAFHVFEWDEHEFEALLGEYFATIDVWGQRFLPRSLLRWPIRKAATLLKPGLYLDADGSPQVRKSGSTEVPRYFIAVCRN